MCQGRNVIIIIILFFYCCCCSNVARYIKREFPQPVNEPISLFFSDSNFIPEHSSEMFKVIFSLFLILTGISSGNSLQKNWFFVSQAIQLLGYGIKCKWTIWLDVDWFKWCRSRICEFGSRRDIPIEFHWRLKIHLERYSKKCSLATVEFTGKSSMNNWAQPSGQSPSLETDDARRRNNLLTNYSIQEIITVIQLSTRLALPPPLRIASRTHDVRPTLSSIVIATCIAL
jgi:hypothetical protein